MNIKHIKRATVIFEHLNRLDAEIINIEKLAILAACGKSENNIQIKMKDLDAKAGQQAEPKQETDYSNPFLFMMRYAPSPFEQKNDKEDINALILSETISDALVLHILEFLLRDKQRQRNELLSELKQLGVMQ